MTVAAENTGLNEHWISPWCTEDDLSADRLEQVNDVNLVLAVGAATDVLYCLSGRQFRQGRSVVRPVAINSSYGTQSYLYPYSSMSGYGAAWGFAAGWSWTAVGMGWWQNGQTLSELVLTGSPVRRINRVLVNGETLGPWPPSNPNYTLYDGRRLVRTVGGTAANQTASQAWPWNQQLQLSLTNTGTFMVDYEWGKPPPASGKLAAIELATEIAIGLSGSDRCKLPSRVLQVAMEGTSTAVSDPLTYIRDGLTGLPICDLFLASVNPNRLRQKAVILSPNTVLNREQTGFPGT